MAFPHELNSPHVTPATVSLCFCRRCGRCFGSNPRPQVFDLHIPAREFDAHPRAVCSGEVVAVMLELEP